MTRSVLTLALLGIGAVRALPASTTVEDRQILGGGSGGFSGALDRPRPRASLACPPRSDRHVSWHHRSPAAWFRPRRSEQFGVGGSSDREQAIAALELQLLALKSKPDPTDDDLAQIAALEAMIRYTEGIASISAPPGVNTTLTHSHPKRFTLPEGYNGDRARAIDELERQLEALENKGHKTEEDWDEIRDIKEALKYLAGVTSISAPPGSSSTFHPGRLARRFKLPQTHSPTRIRS